MAPGWSGSVSLIARHLSALWYVLSVVLPVIARTGHRPVIFSRFAGMGDIIGTIPAALELKKRHPGAHFIYNCAASFACLPGMGGVTFHVTFCPQIGLVSYWYGWLLAGYYNFGSDDDEFVNDHSELFLLGYARRKGVTVPDTHPRLTLAPGVLAALRDRREQLGLRGSPLVLLHPGPTWRVKQWPQESWAALVKELRARGIQHIVQLGSGAGGYANIGASDIVNIPDIVSLVGQLSLEESLALISQADLFIGVDSGLLHAAVSLRVPAVGLWGATSPQFLFAASESGNFTVSSVECQGCHHRVPRLHWMADCPYSIRCMKAIPVAEVVRACEQALANQKTGPSAHAP